LISGLSSVHSFSSFTTQLLFLPISGHFIYEIVKKLKKDTSASGHSKHGYSHTSKKILIPLVACLFFLLLIVSVLKIGTKSASTIISPLSQISSIPKAKSSPNLASESANVKTLSIAAEDTEAKVNIYEKASALSKIVHKAADNDSFKILSYENKWYKIVINDKISGYVHEHFVNADL
jgi:hypothetical protein